MLLPVGCRYRKGADAGPPDLHNALLSRFHILRCGYKSRKIRSVSSIEFQHPLRILIYIPMQPIIVYGIFNQIELECICT